MVKLRLVKGKATYKAYDDSNVFSPAEDDNHGRTVLKELVYP